MAAPGHCGRSTFSLMVIVHVLGDVSMSLQNVTLNSKNFSLLLSWTPPEDHPPETLYKVELRPENDWLETANCAFPLVESCDVTCTIKSCYASYQARVGSILPESPIVWSQSNTFIPFFNVELGTPQVSVTSEEESITVNLQIKLIQCKETVLRTCLLEKLSYEVEIWDEDEHIKRPIKQSLSSNSLEIQKSELRGNNNCISARSINKSVLKSSNFSQPYCFSLKQEELQTEKYLAVMGSVLGVLFLISIAVAIMKTIIWITSSVKMPAALDFTMTPVSTWLADAQVDVYKLSVATCCYKSEAEIYEQNIALERNLVEETDFLDSADCTDASDEECGNECGNYTDRRWIPDGVMCDEDEMLDDVQHQAPIPEAYQKANRFFDSSDCAVDLQDQESDCTDHNRPQTKTCVDVSNPASFTSDILDRKHSSNSINSVVLDHDEQGSDADIPLISVKVLCCNDGEGGYSDAGDDDFFVNASVSDRDLNFQT
ncbi:uncharacterized protein LOC144508993 [Mustelus asterias]